MSLSRLGVPWRMSVLIELRHTDKTNECEIRRKEQKEEKMTIADRKKQTRKKILFQK